MGDDADVAAEMEINSRSMRMVRNHYKLDHKNEGFTLQAAEEALPSRGLD